MTCLSFLIVNLITTSSFAQDATYLNTGDKATFSGYLVPESTVKQLRNDSLERDLYKTESDLKGNQITLLSNQNDNLAKTLQSTTSLSTWEKIGYFLGGVLVTGLAIKGAHELYK